MMGYSSVISQLLKVFCQSLDMMFATLLFNLQHLSKNLNLAASEYGLITTTKVRKQGACSS